MLVRVCEVDAERAVVELGAVEVAAGGHCGFLVLVLAEAEALRAAGFVVVHETKGDDVADFGEDFFQLVFRGVVGNVAYEHGGARRTTHGGGGGGRGVRDGRVRLWRTGLAKIRPDGTGRDGKDGSVDGWSG